MSNYILFDVGANWGTDSLEITRDNKDYVSYVFEPVPTLLNLSLIHI